MNPETVDSEFAKLQQEADQAGQAVAAFAQKLQAASSAGDTNAREWLLDLKSIGLQIQQEQLQMQSLLQALHDFTVSQLSASAPAAQQQYASQPQYAPQPMYNQQQGAGGGMLSRFLGGGFGRAIVTGAGFGIGDDIINHIL
jgi:hypothetical protein